MNSKRERGISSRMRWVAVVGWIALLCGMPGCGAGSDPMVQDVREAVLLLPPLDAGQAGWCLVTVRDASEGAGCGTTRPGNPMVAQSLHSGGVAGEVETGGIDLTTSAVAAITVNGKPLATRQEAGLPNGLRVAAWRIPGMNEDSRGFPPTIGALDASGTALHQTTRPVSDKPGDGGLLVAFPSENIQNPSEPPVKAACIIKTDKFAGVVATGGVVIDSLSAYAGLVGDAFTVCATTEYSLDGWPVKASILVDAREPGRDPSVLPTMKPIPGDSGVYRGLGVEGHQIARRVMGGWLVVSKGKDQSQQLRLLNHLRGRVKLGKGSYG